MCNLTSFLPLAVGLPVRLKDNVDRDKQLYRGRRGFVYGWTLGPACVSIETEGEHLIDHLPLVIYVHYPEATWKVGHLPQGVYPLAPRTRTWKVSNYTGIEAQRKGYTLLPDFASTAHILQ